MSNFKTIPTDIYFRQPNLLTTLSTLKPQRYGKMDIHRYTAKMLGRIAEDLIEKYSKPGDIILDPFCGLSTVLLKSREKNRNSIGIDINPLAVLISRVKLAKYKKEELKIVAEKLLTKIKYFKGPVIIPKFDNIDYWFDKKVQKELAKILFCINHMNKGKYRDFFLVCFSSIVRKVSNADPSIPPPVFSKRMRKIIGKRKLNVIDIFEKETKKNMNIVNNLNETADNGSSRILVGDARKISLSTESVDMVITSPPYMDAQKYVRTLSLELLWSLQLSRGELIDLNKKIIGTDRILRKNIVDKIGIELADKYVNKIMKKDKNRALIIYEYLIQMKKSIEEIYRVLKVNGIFGLVIGNNTVKEIKVPFHKIFSQVSNEIGFELIEKRRDKIKYRGFMLKRNKTAGLIDSEWILVFKKNMRLLSNRQSYFKKINVILCSK